MEMPEPTAGGSKGIDLGWGLGIGTQFEKHLADLSALPKLTMTALELVFHFVIMCLREILDLSEHHLENKNKYCPSELTSQVCLEKAIHYCLLMSFKKLNGNYIKYCH